MFAMKLNAEIDKRLSSIAVLTGKPKQYYVKQAVLNFLEDKEDIHAALESLNDNEPSIPFEQIVAEAGFKLNDLDD